MENPLDYPNLQTQLPGPKATVLHDRLRAAVPRAAGATMPTFAVSAGTGSFTDVDGNELLDFASGIAVTTVGAAAPRVVKAVQDQAALFTHSSSMITPYELYIEVAEQLNELTPGDHQKKTILFNSGAEAVENAVKIARAYTGRQAIVAFDHAFHGRTNMAMALTAKSVPYKHGFGPFASEIYRIPTSYPYRDGQTGEEALARATSMMEKQIGGDQIAAVIIEPIQGEGGFIEPAPGFLPGLQKWCTENGVVFVADEIQSGMARTGQWFACEKEGVVPDLVTIAKGVAGGMPLSAVTGRAEMMDAPGPGGLGGTYGGNPVACAAALATIETIKEDNLLERAMEIEAVLKSRLQNIQVADPRVGDIRGRGAMVGIELIEAETGRPDPTLTGKIAKKVREAGVILLTCGTYGNVIRLLPPLTMSDKQLHSGLDIIETALKES